MNVVTASGAQAIFPINEYNLEGRVTIRDKTNGIGKAVFSSILTEKYQRSSYEIFINNKKLIFPACSNPSTGKGLVFAGSLKITFKQKNEFIKITEVDANSKTIFYVDPRKDVAGIAYDVYSYVPMEISLENAVQKIQSINTDFPNFKGDMTVYNRHGVAVFGRDNSTKNYALCWAGPSEEKVHMIKGVCERYRDGGTSIAKSEDGQVNFRYLFGKEYYLNAEPATFIS